MKFCLFLATVLIAHLPPSMATADTPSVILTESQRGNSLNSKLNSPALQDALDEISNSIRVTGNDSLLLINGIMSYPTRYALLEKAKKSIIVSTFSIYSQKTPDGRVKDPLSRKFVELLIRKRHQGVKVLVIYDGATSVLAQSQPAIDRLRAYGIKVIKYNPVVSQYSELSLGLSIIPGTLRFLTNQNPIDNRWHEKTMIVDGTYLISGGLNWGELYGTGNTFSAEIYSASSFFNHPLIQEVGVARKKSWGRLTPTAWRDTDVLIKGPVVTQATRRLLMDFSLIDMLSEKRSRWI